MWKPFKGVCIACKNENIIVVKAGRCDRCNYSYKNFNKKVIKRDKFPTISNGTKPPFSLDENRPYKNMAPIKKVSDKKKKLDIAYSILRKQFLKNNPTCIVKRSKCTNEATTVHHSKGKVGDLYIDDKFFVAACLNCHFWVEENPIEAKKLGFSKSRLSTL